MAYLHQVHNGDDDLLARLRAAWPGALLLNRPDADLAARIRDVEDGPADVATIGKMALANPDLIDRVRRGSALNAPDPATFFGGDRRGYTDYPALAGR
jgi:N-ethylmaleimide reductase